MMQILERLRQARETQGVDLEALAHRTRLRTHLLEAVEQGRWDALPRGVYARAVVRAYAEAVGLDPNRVITEVAPMLPEPEDPLDGLARVRGLERQPAAAAGREEAPAAAPPAGWPAEWRPAARSAGVAATDTAVLLAVVGAVTTATAALCGVTVDALIGFAAPAIAAQALLVAAVYFVLLGGIGGGTLGQRLLEPAETGERFRGTLGDAARRAGRLVLRESSVVLSAAWPWPSPDPAAGTREALRSRTRLAAEAPAR